MVFEYDADGANILIQFYARGEYGDKVVRVVKSMAIITEMRTISHSGRLARGDLFKPMRSIHTTKA